VRPGGLTIIAGGAPTEHQIAALAAAVTALLDDERREVPDRALLAYGSRWRRSAIVAAVAPFVARGGA